MMHPLLREIGSYMNYARWLCSGKPVPPPSYYKRKRLLRVANQFGCSTFLETGTYLGQTVTAFRKKLPIVLSVEIFPPLFEWNKQRFSSDHNIHIFLGDSAVILPEMLLLAQGRILFWLDGHFSGPGTGIGDSVSPLEQELEIINNLERKDHCILIDDLRCFGSEGYPSADVIRSMLLSINPHYNISYDYDCLVALPESK